MIALSLLCIVLCAVIEHWVGGAGLFRGKKSRDAAEAGNKNFFWDTRAIPYVLFFGMIQGFAIYLLGFEWYSFALPAIITAGYIWERQRSHRPVFKALNANTDGDQGNKLTTQAVNTFTKYDMDTVNQLSEQERFRVGVVWGAWFGALGYILPAIALFPFIGFFAAAFPLLGALFGPIHKLFGLEGKLNAGGFGRSWSEITTGAVIIAPYSIGTLLLFYAGFRGLIG